MKCAQHDMAVKLFFVFGEQDFWYHEIHDHAIGIAVKDILLLKDIDNAFPWLIYVDPALNSKHCFHYKLNIDYFKEYVNDQKTV